MLKKLLLAVATLVTTMGLAFADVDVNKGDQAALDSIKGIGPVTSTLILKEREKGAFKDWADFEARVKGVGPTRGTQFSNNGLTVDGKKRDVATAGKSMPAKAGDAMDKAGDKISKTADKAEAKMDKAGDKAAAKTDKAMDKADAKKDAMVKDAKK